MATKRRVITVEFWGDDRRKPLMTFLVEQNGEVHVSEGLEPWMRNIRRVVVKA